MTVPVSPVYALQMVLLIFFVDVMLFVVYRVYLIARFYIKLIFRSCRTQTDRYHTDMLNTDQRTVRGKGPTC